MAAQTGLPRRIFRTQGYPRDRRGQDRGNLEEGVTISTADGKNESIPYDSVLVVNRHKKNDQLAGALEGKVKEVYVIGDAMSDKPGYVFQAIHSAADVALQT